MKRQHAPRATLTISVVHNFPHNPPPTPAEYARSRVALASCFGDGCSPPPPPQHHHNHHPLLTAGRAGPTLTVVRPTDDSRGVSSQCASVLCTTHVARALRAEQHAWTINCQTNAVCHPNENLVNLRLVYLFRDQVTRDCVIFGKPLYTRCILSSAFTNLASSDFYRGYPTHDE